MDISRNHNNAQQPALRADRAIIARVVEAQNAEWGMLNAECRRHRFRIPHSSFSIQAMRVSTRQLQFANRSERLFVKRAADAELALRAQRIEHWFEFGEPATLFRPDQYADGAQ